MTCPASSSGDIAAGTSSVSALPGRLLGVTLFGGSATSSIILYDNAAGTASGTVLARLQCAASTGATYALPHGVVVNRGIAAVVAGTGAIAVVHFSIG